MAMLILSAGLNKAYRCHINTNILLRMIMALALLPADHIGPVFAEICKVYLAKPLGNRDQLLRFLRYFEKNWVDGKYPPKMWSVFQEEFRTNNDVEGN